MEWKIIDLMKWGEAFFEKHGVDSPRLNMELLICKVTGCTRIDVYTGFDAPLTASELEVLRDYVKRRAAREPLQYILGEADFFGLKLKIGPSVLIPRPETEELASLVLSEIPDKGAPLRILDIGAGSGCLGLALAKSLPSSTVTLIDISGESLHLCKWNADANGISNYKMLRADIFSSIPDEKYEIIVSNPPYIPANEVDTLQAELAYEPRHALTDKADGYTFYRRFVTIFPDLLSYEGRAWLEHGLGQGEKIRSIMRDFFDCDSYKDFGNIERFMSLRPRRAQ